MISITGRYTYITNKWHLDEVVTIKKQQYHLWRSVDSEGNVLRVIVTDKLKSYEAAKKQGIPRLEH